ncbi:hypothetical protein Tco_0751701 [Tanacetum coccineum]|uniref:Reverse transcriptase domain-containing protein n=1 Tax=Tanacetum coccineum TaxID=301880 RepID=A0ABQ4Z5S8_9ASTR
MRTRSQSREQRPPPEEPPVIIEPLRIEYPFPMKIYQACPHHGFSELHQLDTFYNALNIMIQDSLNSAAGGNFLDKMPRECLKIIGEQSKVRQHELVQLLPKEVQTLHQAVSPDVAELRIFVRAFGS